MLPGLVACIVGGGTYHLMGVHPDSFLHRMCGVGIGAIPF